MINKVILIGNLGGDPDIRKLENGTSVGNFRIATNENYQDKQGVWQTNTEWHNIVVWRWLAEKAERSLKKGTLVYIEGKLTTRNFTDKEGIERYRTEIVAQQLKVLEKREDSPFSSQGGESVSGMENTGSSTGSSTPEEKEVPGPDDDLPF